MKHIVVSFRMHDFAEFLLQTNGKIPFKVLGDKVPEKKDAPDHAYMGWSAREDLQLLEAKAAGASWKQIGRELGRSAKACALRCSMIQTAKTAAGNMPSHSNKEGVQQ